MLYTLAIGDSPREIKKKTCSSYAFLSYLAYK